MPTTSVRSAAIDSDPKPAEFIRGPKWRTRTTPARRRAAAIITFGSIVVVGLLIVTLVSVGLDALGASGRIIALVWLVPAAATVVWTLRSPGPALLGDDDDHGWSGYAVRSVMVGTAERRRRTSSRALLAFVFGAPIVWSFVVLVLIELTGIV